jgi:hypothetical protein
VYGILGLVLYLLVRLALRRVLTMHEAGLTDDDAVRVASDR